MPQIAIYRLPAVCEVTGLSRATIYRMLKRGEFPAKVQLSQRCIGWRVADVEAWLEWRAGDRPPNGGPDGSAAAAAG